MYSANILAMHGPMYVRCTVTIVRYIEDKSLVFKRGCSRLLRNSVDLCQIKHTYQKKVSDIKVNFLQYMATTFHNIV